MKLAAANPHGDDCAQSVRRSSRKAVSGICRRCVLGKSPSHLFLGLRPFQVAILSLSFLFLLAKWFMTPVVKWIMTKWVLFETLLSVYTTKGSFSDIYSWILHGQNSKVCSESVTCRRAVALGCRIHLVSMLSNSLHHGPSPFPPGPPSFCSFFTSTAF